MIYCGLKEMCVVIGRSGATSRFPIHRLTEKLEASVVDILPAVHAMTCLLQFDSSLLHQNVQCVFIQRFRKF